MAELDPASAVATCERALRQIMSSVYSVRYGPQWLADVAAPARIEAWKERANREASTRGKRGVVMAGGRELDYAEFYDLLIIADRHWEPLQPAFGRKKETLTLLWQAEKLRNTVAHSRELLPFERDLLAGVAGLVRNQVTIYMSSLDPAGDYYPRIEAVRDNFGNVAVYQKLTRRWHAATNIILRVGDQLRFECTAFDPQGRELTWGLNKLPGEPESCVSRGSSASLTRTIVEEDVGERFGILIVVALSSARYHRWGQLKFDDLAAFSYHVIPPSS